MATLHQVGAFAHDAEARAIQWMATELPEDWDLYSNVHLQTGRRPAETYEHDVIVVAPHGVYTVELKAFHGTVRGGRDRWQLADGRWVHAPLALTEDKARTLGTAIQNLGVDYKHVRVQAVIFVTGSDARLELDPTWAPFVRTRKDLLRALKDPEVYQVRGTLSAKQRTRVKKLVLGGRPRSIENVAGDYDLVERVAAPGAAYDAWLGRHRLSGRQHLLHVYTLPDAPDQRERVRVHALREATIQEKLLAVPDVLRMHGYFQAHDPPRIVLPFEDGSALVPLATWVRDPGSTSLHTRLELALRLARALQSVHAAGIVHRRLSPDVVLVEPAPAPRQLRLCAFDLGKDLYGDGHTVTGSLLRDPAFRCIAPEVFTMGVTTPRSDLFSLGAVLVELLGGRPLFAVAEDVVAPFELPPLAVDGQPVPAAVQALVARLLARDPARRPASVDPVVDLLDGLLRPAGVAAPPDERLVEGAELRGLYELVEVIGRGATGPVWKARHLQTGEVLALKVAPSDHSAALETEGEVLRAVQHGNLVQVHNQLSLDDGRLALLTRYVDGVDVRVQAGAGDPVTPAQLRTFATGLYGALAALHDAGWLHRDLKPENVVVDVATLRPTLLDLGIACRQGTPGELARGSVGYKDPALWGQGGWAVAHDLYAAALTTWELLTDAHPWGRGQPTVQAPPQLDAAWLPDTLDPAARERLVAWFQRALAPEPQGRPASAQDARDSLLAALDGPDAAPALFPASQLAVRRLPDDARPDDPVQALDLSSRARGTLARLGIRVLAELAALDAPRLRALPGVGSRTARELLTWADQARHRWPDRVQAPPLDPGPALMPTAVGDGRPLSALGRALTAALRVQLQDQGIDTIGALAALPVSVLRELPGVGPTKIERLRQALGQLHQDVGTTAPASLAALLDQVRAELGAPAFTRLSLRLGLADGAVLSTQDLAEREGVSRQAVQSSLARALDGLRAEAIAADPLRRIAEERIGDIGLATLERVADAIARRLPPGPDAHPLGAARLAALLLQPDATPSGLSTLRVVARPPWTLAQVEGLARQLEAAVDFPPLPREPAAQALWATLPPALRQDLASRAQGPLDLLDALLPLCPHLRADADGALYQPPVSLAPALAHLRAEVPVGAELPGLLAWLEGRLPGVVLAAEATEVQAALEGVGLALREGRVVDPAAAEAHRPRS